MEFVDTFQYFAVRQLRVLQNFFPCTIVRTEQVFVSSCFPPWRWRPRMIWSGFLLSSWEMNSFMMSGDVTKFRRTTGRDTVALISQILVWINSEQIFSCPRQNRRTTGAKDEKGKAPVTSSTLKAWLVRRMPYQQETRVNLKTVCIALHTDNCVLYTFITGTESGRREGWVVPFFRGV